MIIPVYCDKCEGHYFSVETDELDFPFHSDMFPVDIDAIYSRTWIFPPGPVNMELTCPGCGGFPFEFRDGMPSGRIKVRDDKDSRFLKLEHWSLLQTNTPMAGGLVIPELVESLPASDLKPISKTQLFKAAAPEYVWTGTKCGCTKTRSAFYDSDMSTCKQCLYARKRKPK